MGSGCGRRGKQDTAGVGRVSSMGRREGRQPIRKPVHICEPSGPQGGSAGPTAPPTSPQLLPSMPSMPPPQGPCTCHPGPEHSSPDIHTAHFLAPLGPVLQGHIVKPALPTKSTFLSCLPATRQPQTGWTAFSKGAMPILRSLAFFLQTLDSRGPWDDFNQQNTAEMTLIRPQAQPLTALAASASCFLERLLGESSFQSPAAVQRSPGHVARPQIDGLVDSPTELPAAGQRRRPPSE